MFQGSLGKEVARDLLDGELVEGHIVAVSVENPVAPWPHIARAVVVKYGGVPVAGSIHPHEGHPFSILIGGEQAIDHFFVGIG